MQPVIIGVKKKPRDKNIVLPKINGFMYIPINNKEKFPHEGPLVLISNIRDTLLPGEQLILGPYCDCTKCIKEKEASAKNPKPPSGATEPKPSRKREIVSALAKQIKQNRIFTSTPNERTASNKPKNNEMVQQPINPRNVQTTPNKEFSDIDSDSGWEKRQELISQLNKDLEHQVEMELKEDLVKLCKTKASSSNKDCNSNHMNEGQGVESDERNKGVDRQSSVNREKKTGASLPELNEKRSGDENNSESPQKNGYEDCGGFKLPGVSRPKRTRKAHNGKKSEAQSNDVNVPKPRASRRRQMVPKETNETPETGSSIEDGDGFQVPQVTKSRKRKRTSDENSQKAQGISEVEVSKMKTSMKKRWVRSTTEGIELFEIPRIDSTQVFGRRRTLYSPSNSSLNL